MRRIAFLIVFAVMLEVCWGQCRMANWWGALDNKGWAKCDSTEEYMKGMWRNDNKGGDDGVYLIEEAKCCRAPAPNAHSSSTCITANWWGPLDNEYTWALCPTGYFMQGIWRNDCKWLYCIEWAECCKPVSLPDSYNDCYDENVWGTFDHKGLSQCRDGYYMTGIYRSDCDKLYCLEHFKCCKMHVDVCNPNPCINGMCYDTGNQNYICECNSGYTGTNCDQAVGR